MKTLIKILGQTYLYPALTADVGPGYVFNWDEERRAYLYEPKSQKEIDEIFDSQLSQGVWMYCPVLVDGGLPAESATPDALAAKDEEIERLNDLVDGAKVTIAALRAEIGSPAVGSHPDEAKPRAKTWHAERANWIKETAGLRRQLAKAESPKATRSSSKKPAPAAAPVAPPVAAPAEPPAPEVPAPAVETVDA